MGAKSPGGGAKSAPMKGWAGTSPSAAPIQNAAVITGPKLTLESLKAQASAKGAKKSSAPSLMDIQNEQVGSTTDSSTGQGGGGIGWAAVAGPKLNGNTSRWNTRTAQDLTDAEKTNMATIQADAEATLANAKKKPAGGGDAGLFWDEDEDDGDGSEKPKRTHSEKATSGGASNKKKDANKEVNKKKDAGKKREGKLKGYKRREDDKAEGVDEAAVVALL